jgi:hypothetical protein
MSDATSASSPEAQSAGAAPKVVDLSGVRFSWNLESPPVIDIESMDVEEGERILFVGLAFVKHAG